MTLKIEKQDGIFQSIINRPEVRNAVDGATAEALAEAFNEFDQTLLPITTYFICIFSYLYKR